MKNKNRKIPTTIPTIVPSGILYPPLPLEDNSVGGIVVLVVGILSVIVVVEVGSKVDVCIVDAGVIVVCIVDADVAVDTLDIIVVAVDRTLPASDIFTNEIFQIFSQN